MVLGFGLLALSFANGFRLWAFSLGLKWFYALGFKL
jgi:hypothetical protein